jgi:glycogen(starch) synthase
MRILCQSDGYLPDVIGGVEVLSALLCEHLLRRDHEILVITSSGAGRAPGYYSRNSIPIRALGMKTAIYSKNMADIAQSQTDLNDAVLEFRPDVIHINATQPSNFYLLRRGRLKDMPRLVVLHSPVNLANSARLQNRLVLEADVVVAVSDSIAEDAIKILPGIAPKLKVIRNALPFPTLQPAPLPTDPVTFLCVGRVAGEKGMDVAVDAVGMLREHGIAARLIIAGSGVDRKSLEQAVQDRTLQSHVQFLGWILPEDIPRIINLSTAVLVPSRWKEPFGLVALQAAQMGRAVVASRVGSLSEIVLDGETGLLVAPNDVEALARAMIDLVRHPEKAAAMGEKARLHAHLFDFNALVTQYENAYISAKQTRINNGQSHEPAP